MRSKVANLGRWNNVPTHCSDTLPKFPGHVSDLHNEKFLHFLVCGSSLLVFWKVFWDVMNFPNRFQTGLNPPLNRLKLVLNRFETGLLDSKYMSEVLTRQPVLCDNKKRLSLFLDHDHTRDDHWLGEGTLISRTLNLIGKSQQMPMQMRMRRLNWECNGEAMQRWAPLQI
jgi:hypothetical protein